MFSARYVCRCKLCRTVQPLKPSCSLHNTPRSVSCIIIFTILVTVYWSCWEYFPILSYVLYDVHCHVVVQFSYLLGLMCILVFLRCFLQQTMQFAHVFMYLHALQIKNYWLSCLIFCLRSWYYFRIPIVRVAVCKTN